VVTAVEHLSVADGRLGVVIIDRGTAPYAVHSDDPVSVALAKIAANKARLVFCVDSHGMVLGSISDGDFRRWVIASGGADLSRPAIEVANRRPVIAQESASMAEIEALFASRPGVERLPVVDARGRLVAVASHSTREVRIGRHTIGPDSPAVVIAEIGNNHQGEVDRARHLVDLAVEAGADMVKFQLRDMDSLYRGSGDLTAGEDLGPQYTLNLLAKYSLSADDMDRVLDHCRDVDIDAICTPWDLPSLDHLVQYGVPGLKIASADLTNHQLLGAAADTHLPLLISTGMSSEQEIRQSVELVRKAGAPYALLHCQSTYPAPFKDVHLRYLPRLAEIGGDCPVGYSGHERGFHIPVAAVALGAKIVEKHFTTDKSLEGNDHKVSLLPDEFESMVRQIREVEQSLGTSDPRDVSTGEMMTRANLAKSLVAARDIQVGDLIDEAAVAVKSPGRGLQPNHLSQLVGRTARRAVSAGDFFYPTDLSDSVSKGRQYSFRRPWGLPVRYHDYESLLADTSPDFVEFHFSYKDVEIDPATVFTSRQPMGFTCHTPDLYSGDFLIDLAEFDDERWERSITEVQKVIDIARDLRQWFIDEPPVVICTMGGFSRDGRLPRSARRGMYDRIAQALARIDSSGVRLTAQTLPPYPWLMGGQLFDNLFMDPEDTVEFCEREGVRLTLDISHSKLAANDAKRPFSEFVELMAPYADHLHVVDASGIDGEGPQIGEGEVDWPQLAAQLDRLAPGVGFIPEIWQGHVNNGERFWTALERLEAWF